MDTYTTLKKYGEDIVTLNNNNILNSNEFNYSLKPSKSINLVTTTSPKRSNRDRESVTNRNQCTTTKSDKNSKENLDSEKGQLNGNINGVISTKYSEPPKTWGNSDPEKVKDNLRLRVLQQNSTNAEIDTKKESQVKYRESKNNNNYYSSKTQQLIAESISESKIQRKIQESFEPCSFLDAFYTYMCYFVLVVVGYVNDLVRPRTSQEKHRVGYTQLYASFESFYTRHVYRRVRDSWNVPICSVPGEYIQLVERSTPDNGWTIEYTGKTIKCINLGSYNYLGFAENHGPCAEDTIKIIKSHGINTGSSRKELGSARLQHDLEALVARFVGTEDAFTCAMGFATNSLNLPCILDSNCLVISDEKNHASIILGLRTSGATCRVFKHNNMKSLEKRLREGIVNGRPKTHLPWDKVFIVVEGVYSMEGSIVRLPEILELKRKYNAYLYVDEAHSIGAIGPRGRGVCDYWGINPRDIDILMGTFTKSFGSAGGYIAGSHEFIRMLRKKSHAQTYGTAMSPPVAEQIMSSMKIIMGEDGTKEGVRRIHQLARNSRYFRQKLKQMGFIVYGNDDSPVIPVALYMPSKIAFTVREMIKRGVAIVGVGFPATPLVEGRIRFCMSASHTKQMLDYVLKEFGDIGDSICARTSSFPKHKGEIKYDEV